MLCILDSFLMRVFKKPPEKQNPNQTLTLNRKHGWRGRKSDQVDPTSFSNDGAIINEELTTWFNTSCTYTTGLTPRLGCVNCIMVAHSWALENFHLSLPRPSQLIMRSVISYSIYRLCKECSSNFVSFI